MRTSLRLRRLPGMVLLVAPVTWGCGSTVSGSTESKHDDAGTIILLPPIHHEAGTETGTGRDAGAAIDAGPPAMLIAIALTACDGDEYVAPVTVGGSQTFQMAVDTGSTTLGVASTTCTSCGVSPEYAPGATATDQHESGSSQYGTGSWSGEIYDDTVRVGSGPSAPDSLVAIDTQSGFFQPGVSCQGQGILGMGPTSAAVSGTIGFFDQLVADARMPDVFATMLCGSSGGTLWLGGYDPRATTAPPQYTPLLTSAISQYYYSVALASITAAGTSVPVATTAYEDSVVDTGTSLFILQSAAFSAVTAAIGADQTFQKIFGGASWFGNPENCVQVTETKAELDAQLPGMTLVFGDAPAISVQALATESYLVPFDGLWCPALYSTSSGPDFPFAAIIGSPALRSNIVVFDRANQRVGFAPHAPCP